MQRPNIKDFFPEDAPIQYVQRTYLSAPELWNYVQSLDNYIDSLESPSPQPSKDEVKEWKESELSKVYKKMKVDMDRLAELEEKVKQYEKRENAALKLAASNWKEKQPSKDVEAAAKDMDNETLLKVFKGVSLFDLSDCEFEYGQDEVSWINANQGGRVIDAIQWDGNIFLMMNNNCSFSPLNPMRKGYSIAGAKWAEQGKEATPVKRDGKIKKWLIEQISEDFDEYHPSEHSAYEEGVIRGYLLNVPTANIEELKKRFAAHLISKNNELDTSDGYAVEWTVKNLNK